AALLNLQHPNLAVGAGARAPRLRLENGLQVSVRRLLLWGCGDAFDVRRHREAEPAAFVQRALDPDVSSLELDQAAHQRQPQTRTFVSARGPAVQLRERAAAR